MQLERYFAETKRNNFGITRLPERMEEGDRSEKLTTIKLTTNISYEKKKTKKKKEIYETL